MVSDNAQVILFINSQEADMEIKKQGALSVEIKISRKYIRLLT